jgi:hypothetical protein
VDHRTMPKVPSFVSPLIVGAAMTPHSSARPGAHQDLAHQDLA